MKILIAYSANKSNNEDYTFINDQTKEISKLGINVDYFGIKGKGIKGYLMNYKRFLHKIKSFQPDIIHAHYGLSGLLGNLQRKIPVITTYHGSDLNNYNSIGFSFLSILLSAFNIFVSEKRPRITYIRNNYDTIPCGVDIDLFKPYDKNESRRLFGLDDQKKYVLFSSSFNNTIKNANLAKLAVNKIANTELLELKGYSRSQVSKLISAVDACLLTSFKEGSPQFIKEAMACCCPIVSVDVGDIKYTLGNTQGCYISSFDVIEIEKKLKMALSFKELTNGRERIIKLGLGGDAVANRIVKIYNEIIK